MKGLSFSLRFCTCVFLSSVLLSLQRCVCKTFCLLSSSVMKRNVKTPRFYMLQGIRFSSFFFITTEETKIKKFFTHIFVDITIRRLEVQNFREKIVNPA